MLSQLHVRPAAKPGFYLAPWPRLFACLLPLVLLVGRYVDPAHGVPVTSGLVLHLRADLGVTGSPNVTAWADQSGQGHSTSGVENAPQLVPGVLNGKPVVRFDGNDSMTLTGQVLSSQQFTIMSVVNDTGTNGSSHREIFSNWDGGGGNTVTSVFFGTTTGALSRNGHANSRGHGAR